MYDNTGKRITSQVTSGRDYSAQEPHPDLITEVPTFVVQGISTFDEYVPPAVGTRFDIGSTAIEYAGEYYVDYNEPRDVADADFRLLHSDTHEPFEVLESEFERVDDHSNLKRDYHGIWHGTINSGYLIRLTDDGEGAFLFRHWGL